MNGNKTTEMTAEQKGQHEREQLIAKANEVVETYAHGNAESLGHLAEMVEMLGYNATAKRIWDMQNKAGSADFDRERVNRMYSSYGFSEEEMDKEDGNVTLSWNISEAADKLLEGRVDSVEASYGEDYISAEDVHNILHILHADPTKLASLELRRSLLHDAAYTLGEHNDGLDALMNDMGYGEIKRGLETKDSLNMTPIQIAKQAIEERRKIYEREGDVHDITGVTIRDGMSLLHRMEEITITSPIQAARVLKAEFESGKGILCPETFVRNHITSLNDKALRTFDYCTNVVSGAISASAISAINGGKYDGWTEDDFAREYIKSMQELCNAAGQYYGPVQFDDFKRHLDDTAKRLGIEQEPGKAVFDSFIEKLKVERQKSGGKDVSIGDLSQRVYRTLSAAERTGMITYLNTQHIPTDKAFEKMLQKAVDGEVKAKKRQHANDRER